MEKLENVNLPENNEQYNKVLQWFFSFPTKSIGLNELCKQVHISKANANRIITRLEKEGFLIKEIIGRAWRVKCKQEHIYNKTKKVAFNLSMIFNSGIIEKLNKKYPSAQAIILFGSYRKGDDIETSDIDLALNLMGNKELKLEELGVVERLGFRKNVPINLHLFSNQNISKNLFSNIANGIILEGFLEVKP